MNKGDNNAVIVFLETLLGVAILCGVSWFILGLTLKAITWCFGLAISWKVITGSWLCLILVNLLTNKNSEK